MRGQRLAHPLERGLLEIVGAFHGFAEVLERLRDDRVEDRVGIGQVEIGRAHV